VNESLRRLRMSRLLPGATVMASSALPLDGPRQLRQTLIDFCSLGLPADVAQALADAFWHHFGGRPHRTILTHWTHLKMFARFVTESAALRALPELDGRLLGRYVEWLNRQCRPSGSPWSKSTRAGAYTTLRKLLQWLERCRPGLLPVIEYPFNPFPWRNRDSGRFARLSAAQLRGLLRACERDIAASRAMRTRGGAARDAARREPDDSGAGLGALLEQIERDHAGLLPARKLLKGAGYYRLQQQILEHGGARSIEPYLYPTANTLLPYYLTILIHTGGNPDAIAELSSDCLQPLPLLADREMLVWDKRRAGSTQRRAFRSSDGYEPPTLVRELLDWSAGLRRHAPPASRETLFLFKGVRGVSAFTSALAKTVIRRDFRARHGLAHFALASIRPSVLGSFYRASGDLHQVKRLANHAQISTTIRYVEGPEVQAEHHRRVASLQSAFMGHIERRLSHVSPDRPAPSSPPHIIPAGPAVSMFGFDCKDPLAGVAPGTRHGELCASFLGCFTCPNAVITPDPASLARLLQARDHLRQAAQSVHPARWEALYAPPLRILEQDLLPRFAAADLAAAEPLRATLPPLPELR
jgi:hypothetical protein